MLLLERDLAEPDRIVGELLQPGGYLKLKELGLEESVEGIDSIKARRRTCRCVLSPARQPQLAPQRRLIRVSAQRIAPPVQILHFPQLNPTPRTYPHSLSVQVRGYHMYKKGQWAKLNYPKVPGMDDVAGRSFHNGRFVQRLRQHAEKAPNVTIRQGTVKRLVSTDGEEWTEGQPVGGVAYRKPGEPQDRIARAGLTMVCDGMYSGLRTKLIAPDITLPSFFVGLILLNCKLPEPDKAVVILGDPSPILFYPISSTEVRCLVDVPGTKLPSSTDGSLAQYLREVSNQVRADEADDCGC